MSPDDKDILIYAINKSLRNGSTLSLKHCIHSQDGKERIVHQHGEVIYDHTGKPIRMIGTIQDITHLKQVEEQLKRYSANT